MSKKLVVWCCNFTSSYKCWCVTSNDITLNGANLVFEGYLENAYETTLTVAEPTGDRTITLPDSDGVVAMDGDALAYSIVFGS